MFIRMLCVKGKKTSKDWIRSENRRKLAHEQCHVLEIKKWTNANVTEKPDGKKDGHKYKPIIQPES